MSSIAQYLQSIRNAIFARTVRNDIANAIEQCYDDVHNPTLNTEAMQAAVQAKIDQGEMAALTIGDHTITSAKLAEGVIPAADATLTQTGKPADAAATGAAISQLSADLDDVWDRLGIKTDDIITPSNYQSKLPSILNIDVGKDIAFFGLRYDVTKDMITDLPADYAPNSSALIVFPSGTTNRNYQMYLLYRNGGALYTGVKSGNTLIWRTYISDDLYRSGGISMYKRIGVFGDSFSCGSIYDSNGTVLGRHEELSWIANLARRNGCEYRIYGFGGATTKSWLSNETYGKGLYDASTDHCGLYFLAFGINDSAIASYLGTIDDIANKADSFYGNYGKIINLILLKEPKARLVMLGCGRSGERYAPFTNAIKAIANYFNVPYYDQFADYYVSSDSYINEQYSGHPSAHGYASLSRAIERMYSYVCDRNAEYFKSYAGEDYE